MSAPTLIGISGKPGSHKGHFAKPIAAQLRERGYVVAETSIAARLYQELSEITDAFHAGTPKKELASQYNLPEPHATQLFANLRPELLGEKNPQYGYSRRNQHYRQALSILGAQIRRAQDPDGYLKAMVNSLGEDVDFAVFTDLRFPNEADYILDHDGIVLRANLDEEELAAYTEPGDFKYSQQSMNSDVETALDDYEFFYAHLDVGYFNPDQFTSELLEYLGLPEHKNLNEPA